MSPLPPGGEHRPGKCSRTNKHLLNIGHPSEAQYSPWTLLFLLVLWVLILRLEVGGTAPHSSWFRVTVHLVAQVVHLQLFPRADNTSPDQPFLLWSLRVFSMRLGFLRLRCLLCPYMITIVVAASNSRLPTALELLYFSDSFLELSTFLARRGHVFHGLEFSLDGQDDGPTGRVVLSLVELVVVPLFVNPIASFCHHE